MEDQENKTRLCTDCEREIAPDEYDFIYDRDFIEYFHPVCLRQRYTKLREDLIQSQDALRRVRYQAEAAQASAKEGVPCWPGSVEQIRKIADDELNANR